MICDTCGQLLDSVDDSQTERHGRYEKTEFFCEIHKPTILIEA